MMLRRLWRWLFEDAASWEEDAPWLPPSDGDQDGQYGDLR